MTDIHVSFETQLALNIEPTLLDIADDACMGQVVHLLQPLRPIHRETVYHDGQDEGGDYLVDEDDVDVLKDAEDGDAVADLGLLLKEIADKAVDRFEGGEEDEAETGTQVVAVGTGFLTEQEVDEDTEEILQDHEGYHRQK